MKTAIFLTLLVVLACVHAETPTAEQAQEIAKNAIAQGADPAEIEAGMANRAKAANAGAAAAAA